MSFYVTGIKKYIEEHFTEDISLDQIAAYAGYSKYHLNRRFCEKTGMTIHKYIIERRLSEAAKRLSDTDEAIVDIAIDTGYASQQAFTIAFRQMFCCTPNEYRRQRYNVTKICYVGQRPLTKQHASMAPKTLTDQSSHLTMNLSYGRMAA